VAAFNVSDDAAWLTVSPGSGSTPDTLSLSVDATGLTVGTYTATVTATASSYLPGILTVTLSVSTTLAPDQVHLAWVGEPSTTLTVVWRTLDTATPSVVEYRPLGDVTWQSATGALRASGTQGSLHEVTLTSLTPSTTYEYRVTGDGPTLSGVFTTRTAPPPGPADFDAVFVADTGLVGRTDGLATGTQQVVDEIANLNPLLVLAGGDYAYFNTDTRFGSLDNTIDAWFNQMQSIGAQSPMMPTYGNHEVLLGEGFDAWAARFPTPAGFDGRRNYSFDVGDVHFVSILAVSDTAGIGSTTLDWIQQDITAAQAAGKRWIVPYLHVSAFGDGTNHPDNETLRAQLGPLFESLGVKLVLSAQDQAYERTYPLTDVPATNTPTSTSLTCYTMSDGVTWAKISPGGKLSNINGTFSQFATEPPPAWTAFRDNTMHHFSRLIVSASGSIQLDTYGVVGDGTSPVILDSFQYVDGVCPPELRFSTNDLSFTVNEGETDSAPIDLSTNDATVADFTITDNASWLSISPGTGSTPDTLTASVDASALTAGAYTATATATAGGYLSASLSVNLDVGGSYNLFLSSFPDRSSPLPLDGQTVAGDIFVFTGPDAGVDNVNFWVDDPAMTGNPDKKEARAPYDLAGSNSNGTAKATDSTQWPDGPHTVTASIALTDGSSVVVSATFTVDNAAPGLVFSPGALSFSLDEGGTAAQTIGLDTSDGTVATYAITDNASWLTIDLTSGVTPVTPSVSVDTTGLTPGTYTASATATASGYFASSVSVTLIVGGAYDLFMSSFPDRSSPVALDGQTVTGDIFVFTGPDTGVDNVNFWVDDPTMSGAPDKVESNAPYDLVGSNSDGTAKPFDSLQLTDGPHTVTASLALQDGSSVVVSATFTVLLGGLPALTYQAATGDRVIDGAVSDWEGVPLLNVPLTSLDGTRQIDADLQVSLDSDNIYVLVSVHDDYNSNPGQHELSGSLAVEWAIDAGAGPHMGTDGVDWTVSLGAVDLWHWEIDCGPGVISGGIDRTIDGNDPVCNLDDEYATTPFDRQDDSGDNRLMGVYDHTGRATGEDSPGTWYWEISRPLSTLDPQDTQFTPGATAKLALAYWDPDETPFGWMPMGHVQSADLGWIAVQIPTDLGPALEFTPDIVSFSVDEGGTDTGTTGLSTSDGTAANFTITDDAAWLTVSPVTGPTPLTLNVAVDATGLATGVYTATALAIAPGYVSDTLSISLSVGSGSYDLFLSGFADRSSAVPLEGQTASGDIYVFTSPDTDVSSVTFFLDDPTMAGTPQKVENNAPYDLRGTNPDDTAIPYSTALLADGLHTVTAALNVSGGETVVVTASFFVDNGCSPLPCSVALVDLPYELDYDHRHDHGAIPDLNGVGTGFTYIDQPTNGIGYIADNLLVDLIGGTFQITTTAGHADAASNSQDNALGVGIDAPSQISILAATLVNPPAGAGNGEQTGLWFGNNEDNYVKVVAVSTPGGTTIEYLLEVSGVVVDTLATGVLDLTAATVSLSLRADPTDQTITASYSIDGAAAVEVGSFAVPGEFLSFDAAGIDPTIGTRSFGGLLASHGLGPGPLVYTYRDFAVTGEALPFVSAGDLAFTRSSFPVAFPTSIDVGPDGRIYVTELFGTIHALTLDGNKQLVDDQIVSALVDTLGPRLTLGITVDPLSTPTNAILWVSHSSPSLNNGVPNSGMISRISGPGLATIEHIITGLPRAKANHATNSIDFGPDDRLYIAQGGNTGAGAPNPVNTEFGDMEEQPLSAAILVADVRNPTFDGSCANPDDIFGPPPCDVVTYATGLRNAYDFAFHSNGSMYAPDNGLGVAGTYPPSPTPPCFGLADPALHSPGDQPDVLFRIQEGAYHGHPNPYRDECVFKDGSFQGVAPLPNWTPPIFDLGNNRSADGTIEYTADAFCGALNGDLLIANFSVGDDIKRITLSADGLTVLSSETLVAGLADPLPLAQGPDGTIYVGEFGAGQVTALEPVDLGCWTTKQAVPEAILDAGGTALGGKLYMVGGKTGGGHVSTMYVYDPAADAWAAGPDLPGSAVENPAVAAFNGKLYAFGGSTAPFSGAVANAAVYDPATNSWITLAPMNTARGGAAAQAIGGKIYVAGGMDSAGVSVASVEVYDPATDSWSAAAPMTTLRDNPGSAVLDGKLYIFGGRTRGVNDTLSSVEMYDPGTDSWTPRAPMPTGRRTMVVGTLNGRAQVMGGERAADGSAFPQNEEYNPITNTWRTLTPMSTPRHGAAAGTINGVVYVAGGGPTGGLAFTDLVEAFAFQGP
jgi:N-acetylneuraminic acid mutarotase/glucose/arabinose dehydrogenase